MKLGYIKLPLITLAVGIILATSSQLIGIWYKWTPISFAIDLQSGHRQQSPLFSVNLTTNYLIELEVERNLPFDQINCMLGIAPSDSEQCKSMPSIVYLKWFVYLSDKLVAEGTSEDESSGAWGSKISRTIGRFKGEKGEEYIVKVESLNDASELMPTNPHIIVRTHPIEAKEHIVTSQIVGWIAIVFIGIGLLWLFKNIIYQRRLK